MQHEQAVIAAARAAIALNPESFILLASAARATAATAYSTAEADVGGHKVWAFNLDCTVQAGVAGDKLDVTIQMSLDNVVWYDIVHFTQIAGNAGAHKSEWFGTEFANSAAAPIDLTAALGSGVGRQTCAWGNYLRAKYVITDAGAHGQSFTFSVSALGL
jgi:hypothetical protein